MIAVVGSIQTRSWEDGDGKKHFAVEVQVDEAYFTGSRSESGKQNFESGEQEKSTDDFAVGFSPIENFEDGVPF